MDWTTIISSVLAGGLAGQLTTLVGGNWLTERREYRKWLISERHKMFSELISISTLTPKTDEDLKKWTYSIRDASQRIHILFKEGTAPQPLADAIESVFKNAQQAKHGAGSNDLSAKMRDDIRVMRVEMARNLNA